MHQSAHITGLLRPFSRRASSAIHLRLRSTFQLKVKEWFFLLLSFNLKCWRFFFRATKSAFFQLHTSVLLHTVWCVVSGPLGTMLTWNTGGKTWNWNVDGEGKSEEVWQMVRLGWACLLKWVERETACSTSYSWLLDDRWYTLKGKIE